MIRFEMQSGDTIDIELYPEEASTAYIFTV